MSGRREELLQGAHHLLHGLHRLHGAAGDLERVVGALDAHLAALGRRDRCLEMSWAIVRVGSAHDKDAAPGPGLDLRQQPLVAQEGCEPDGARPP